MIQIEKFARELAACTGEFLDHHTSVRLSMRWVNWSNGPEDRVVDTPRRSDRTRDTSGPLLALDLGGPRCGFDPILYDQLSGPGVLTDPDERQ